MVQLNLLTGRLEKNTKYRRHTDPNGGYDQNEIKRNKALTYFKQNALYFGLQYKPSSGAEWKMKYVKIKPYRYN